MGAAFSFEGDPNPLVQLPLSHEDLRAGDYGYEEVVESRGCAGRGGGRAVKQIGMSDLLALFLALLAFGVIVAVLFRNFIGLE